MMHSTRLSILIQKARPVLLFFFAFSILLAFSKPDSSANSPRIDAIYVVSGLVETSVHAGSNQTSVPVRVSFMECRVGEKTAQNCDFLEQIDTQTQVDGTFTAGFDTSKISRRQGEPASASAAADASTTGKQSKSAQPERQLRALVQVNSAQLPGYNKRLTSSRQEVVLSEPVTQVSYVLTPTAGITNEDASATVSAIASASASGSAASSASAEQAKQGFKPTHKPTPAPEKGIMFMFGKLNFIVMRKIAMIWFDIARQFSKRAENPDPAIEALCTVGPVSVAFFCRKAVHTVEWVQHLFQVALGKVERTTYADYVPSFVAYQTCSGMGDAVISSCEPIDAILQIGVLALLALFISLLSFAPKRSKRGSKRGSKQEPVHEPSNIQRFTVGKSGVVGIGKSTENKITKEGKGSEQVFKEVTKSKVARVAWMASSSSSAQM